MVLGMDLYHRGSDNPVKILSASVWVSPLLLPALNLQGLALQVA